MKTQNFPNYKQFSKLRFNELNQTNETVKRNQKLNNHDTSLLIGDVSDSDVVRKSMMQLY